MSETVKTIRWAIVGCGKISKKFALDIIADPSCRGVFDIKHEITAIASSTSKDKALKFKDDCGITNNCECFGSYQEFYECKEANVDIVYIGTPHPSHYNDALKALETGHNLLLEKPMTVTASQARKLVEVAKSKDVFFMEGVWTRFFPLVHELVDIVHKEELIGDVLKVCVDFYLYRDTADKTRQDSWLFNPEMCGGSFMDLGSYPLFWSFLMIHESPKNKDYVSEPPTAKAFMTPLPKEPGCDESLQWVLKWDHVKGIAVCSTSYALPRKQTFARIEGTKGYIEVSGRYPSEPYGYKVYKYDDLLPIRENEIYPAIVNGKNLCGLYWEADNAARCLIDGLKENPLIPLHTSVSVMSAADAIRESAGYKFADHLESTE